MKTIGIIGGLGPETTSEFYSEISFACQEKNKTNRPPILIYSVPISYAIEEDAIARGKGEDRLIPLLTDAAKRLEKAGADFLTMPCNSLHEFITEIRESVKIPVLSIVEETTKFLKKQGIAKVGIISTSITLDKKLYENSFVANGIEQVRPDDFQQAKIGKIIHNLVSNRHSNKDREELISIIDDFETRGINHVILACTDLQLLIPNHSRMKIFDTMKIFADASVEEILK
jgi:aspartate racemase